VFLDGNPAENAGPAVGGVTRVVLAGPGAAALVAGAHADLEPELASLIKVPESERLLITK